MYCIKLGYQIGKYYRDLKASSIDWVIVRSIMSHGVTCWTIKKEEQQK